jgi:hypothetical protein
VSKEESVCVFALTSLVPCDIFRHGATPLGHTKCKSQGVPEI